MGKYGDLIKQGKTSKPDDQMAGKPDSQTDTKQGDQQTSKPDDQIAGKPDEPMKNLCVKVPESWRRHWAAEAKRTGKTMTDVMVNALTEAFGLPDDQQTR